jgi:hypothetical protein
MGPGVARLVFFTTRIGPSLDRETSVAESVPWFVTHQVVPVDGGARRFVERVAGPRETGE